MLQEALVWALGLDMAGRGWGRLLKEVAPELHLCETSQQSREGREQSGKGPDVGKSSTLRSRKKIAVKEAR